MERPPYDRRTNEEFLAERALQEEMEQLRTLSDVMSEITGQGRPLLNVFKRQRLKGKELTLAVSEPGESPFRNIVSRKFSVAEGNVFLWEGLPTAVAVGYLAGDTNPSLVGGVHEPGYLDSNGVNPRSARDFFRMIRTFPGCHIDTEDNLAFAMGKVHNDSLGILIGDSRNDRISKLVIPYERFREKENAKIAFGNVTSALALAFRMKYQRA